MDKKHILLFLPWCMAFYTFTQNVTFDKQEIQELIERQKTLAQKPEVKKIDEEILQTKKALAEAVGEVLDKTGISALQKQLAKSSEARKPKTQQQLQRKLKEVNPEIEAAKKPYMEKLKHLYEQRSNAMMQLHQPGQ